MTLGGSESPDAAVPTFLSERVKQRKLGAFGFSPGGPLLADAVFSSLLSTEEKLIFGQGFSFNSTRARLHEFTYLISNFMSCKINGAKIKVSPCAAASSLTAVNFMSWYKEIRRRGCAPAELGGDTVAFLVVQYFKLN